MDGNNGDIARGEKRETPQPGGRMKHLKVICCTENNTGRHAELPDMGLYGDLTPPPGGSES